MIYKCVVKLHSVRFLAFKFQIIYSQEHLLSLIGRVSRTRDKIACLVASLDILVIFKLVPLSKVLCRLAALIPWFQRIKGSFCQLLEGTFLFHPFIIILQRTNTIKERCVSIVRLIYLLDFLL